MLTPSGNLHAVSVYGRRGASTRVRLYDWFDHLGLHPVIHNYLGKADNQPRTILRSLPNAIAAEVKLRRFAGSMSGHTLIMSKQASPFSSGHLEQRLLGGASHSVYDFDDALYAQDGARRTGRIWSKRDVWMRSIQAANVVIAGSDRLADEASKLTRDVVVIPSCVEPDNYTRKTNYEVGDVPRAVWIGSAATEKFLASLEAPLLALNRDLGLRLTIIGASSGDLGSLEPVVDRQPWQLDTFSAQLAEADVGIMPLPDNELTRGKCSYKLLQYGAAGVPMVGSAVGANISALEKLGGLAAKTSAEWYSAVASILQAGQAERATSGDRAREGVMNHFSFSHWANEWRHQLKIPAN